MSFNPFIGTSNSSGSGGTGQDGRGIQEISWILSSTGTKPGEAGAKDTYQILYTDGSISTFIVQNGNNGRDGAKGESGTNGKDGQNGKDGITPIFRVSSNYIQVSIDNGLNYTNLVSLDSLRGADGESLEFNWLGTKLGIKKAGESEYTYVELKGETGDKGERGENGAEGKSAYQSALDTGFDGTETQWVESLKGEQGLQGVSITAASINNDGHLILTLSSGSTIDAGNAKGADGTSINIKGSLNNSSELPSTGQKIGDCYLINGHLWVYTNSLKETAINGFDDAGNIQGPAGRGISTVTINDSGVMTITYSDGTSNEIGNVIGPQGPQGKQGLQGVQGESGFSPVVSTSKINKVTTVTITDSTGEHTFEINDGIDGTNGEKGEQGEVGKSIEIAVNGDYIQWRVVGDLAWTNLIAVAALKGDKGDQGDKGETGLQGENGEQGPPGVDGKNIELGTSETYIQWRTAGTEEWNNLIPISTLVGSAGRGINSIEFTSSTGGDIAGLAGAIDTYTITYSDNTSSTFTVYNGKNGDSHTHENKDVLDKLSDINGSLGYNNENVFKVWYGTKEEYEALADKKDDWTYIITNDNLEDTIVQFTKAEAREPIQSGDSLGVILGKIAKYLEDLKTVAFTGNYSDLVGRPAEVTDAELNDILV